MVLGRLEFMLMMGALALLGPANVGAQQLFKCGASFQDRPCAAQDTQQRFSATSGTFSTSQVNPDTDRDCAKFAADQHLLWQRMSSGESFEALKAEVDARPISRAEKSQIRDSLTNLKLYKGGPREVRSQLEMQCMNYKRLNGLATERDSARANKYRDDRLAAESARSLSRQDRDEEMRVRMLERQIALEDRQRAHDEMRAAARARAIELRRARDAAR
jgi:hypothetical protein